MPIPLPRAPWNRCVATRSSPPIADGAPVIDDTDGRKDSCATDHVAHQYLGSVDKIDSGLVAVTTLWENEQHYYPLHVMPYMAESRLAGSK